ncbi:MAG: glycosyltransferase family 9 protein [Candidatus Omnitrophota bacterium]
MFKKILIVRIGNIGDVLFTTPLIRILRKNLPHTYIDMLTSAQASVVVEKNPYLNRVFIYKKFHRLERWIRRKILLQKLISQNYDLCIVLESNPEYTNFSYQAAKRAFRAGISAELSNKFLNRSVVFSRDHHAIENYLRIIPELFKIKITADDYQMDFFMDEPPEALKNELEGYRKNGYVVLHPSCSCGLPYRGWPIEKFVEVVRYLTEKQIAVFITGIPADEETQNLLKQLSAEPNVHAFIGRSINEVGYLLKHSKGLLCLDTGILHLARALDVPLVSLFGPSAKHHTGPIGNGRYKVISKDFACSPCQYFPEHRKEEKAKCMDGNVPACMIEITPVEVLAAIDEIILKGNDK